MSQLVENTYLSDWALYGFLAGFIILHTVRRDGFEHDAAFAER